MSAVAGASQQQQRLQQLVLSCSDQDEPKTSSSIIDFLNQEQLQCWSANLNFQDDCASDLDIEGIFDEINRLSGKIHESRSVDEILQEAETLILSQAPIQLKCIVEKWTVDSPDVISKEIVPPAVHHPQEREEEEEDREVVDYVQVNSPKRNLQPTTVVSQSKSESHLSKISMPAELAASDEGLEAITHNLPTAMTFDDDISLPMHHPQPASMSSSIYSPTNSYARERALESEITSLQDKLKDTEERYHAVRLQYDTLRVQYRDVRDQQTCVQDETEKLRLDVKHLNDCASILRNEIHVAREDRSEAIRLQGVLKGELESSRGERKKLTERTDRDSRTILDLQRQCKEMEKILTRKHPDSVSALIVAAKGMPSSAQESAEASRKVLEQRIVQLERDAMEQDAKAQKILSNVQTKFSAIQAKYETHIADLETQVLSLQDINAALNKKIVSLADTLEEQKRKQHEQHQQQERVVAEMSRTATMSTRGTQTVTKASNLPRAVSATATSNNKASNALDNDSMHLMATVRGMRVDLAIKEKALQRLTRELDECKRTIRKLKEMSCKIPVGSSSNHVTTSHKKPYDPMQFTEKVDSSAALKEAHHKLKLLEFDYKALHDKRLQDLKTLQAAHERELSSCQETVRILQQRLAEGDEAQKRRRVPVDYYALKAKVTNLEQRHSEREDRLHMLVEALSKGRLNGILDEAQLKSMSSGRESSDNGSESTVSPNSD